MEIESGNDLVWARMKYCPFWPARVVKTPPTMGRTPRNKKCVFFFGTKQFGFVDSDKIFGYSEHRAKYVSKGKGVGFVDAVHKIDEYILDPVKYKSNACVLIDQVVIKTERDVENTLGIKCEANARSDSRSMVNPKPSSVANTASWAQERQSLIDKIISLTSENQKSTFELKQTQDKLAVLNSAKQELQTKLNQSNEAHMKKVDKLNSELSETNAVLAKLRSDNRDKILELTREKDLAQARLKQVQNGIARQQIAVESSAKDNDDGFCEVEKLLADKMVQKRIYLVRWKRYGSSDDSWVEEANLNCPSILKKYKQLKRK
ncbi:hepatoma-derived growth factor-related protein 2-like [Sitodiplosis mosellana]|uniref:hepatoma-derived growth factor-related protein 2-like n=1 Tax=Sitodiplosis mosellana TaxID=263140 RepID=UPI002444C177|nr:hepatoma-derived growth factor-related protein 2-like [Sitodiplosis mosellana]